MPMVSTELGIGAFEGGVAVGLWSLDTVEGAHVSAIPVQEHCAIEMRNLRPSWVGGQKGNRTRSCELSCSDCVDYYSLTWPYSLLFSPSFCFLRGL